MNFNDNLSRRTMLTAAPALGAAAFATSAADVQADENKISNEFVRVGCLNVRTYSHLAASWARLINPDRNGVRFTGMRITHCWDIEPGAAEAFAKDFGCQAVKNFDDMLGKVDAVISGGYYNHPWNHILHEPYLEAGLPNLINRPFANSLIKARKMVETAKKSGATILVPSAFEHTNAIVNAKAWASQHKVTSYNATNGAEDYPTHGIHGVYMVFRSIVEAGNPVASVAYQAKSWYAGPAIMTFEHRDKKGRPFFGTLHQTDG